LRATGQVRPLGKRLIVSSPRFRAKLIRQLIATLFQYILLIAIGLLFIWPFAWMASSSLKASSEVFTIPIQWLPSVPKWENYAEVLREMPFGRFILNSLLVATLTTVGQLGTCSLSAYGFSRLRFPGRDVIFMVLLSTMMIPYEATLIPIYLIMFKIGLIDKLAALWLPSFFGGAFGTFLLRQFFMTVPTDLEDAARIDGCNRFDIYRRIFLPLSKPALATLGVFVFMGSWNDLLGPVVFLNHIQNFTLSIGLTAFQGYYVTEWHLLMAASMISVVPILVIYAFTQRYFVEGITLTGIKG
jgi:multiple sugar transport system permease protein